MTYVITKTLGPFSTVFRNWHATHSHCSFLHGHDLVFEITLEADTLDHCGWVIDFAAFKDLRKSLESMFDHKVIISEDDPHLDAIGQLSGLGVLDYVTLPQVGCEAFALLVAVEATNMLQTFNALERVRVAEVQCYEQHNNVAGFRP